MTVLALAMAEKNRADIFQTLSGIDDLIAAGTQKIADTYNDDRMLTVPELTADSILPVLVDNQFATKITRICSFNEYSVMPAAELRARLGIEGQTVDDAIRYRDKFIMKELVKHAVSFKVPKFADQSSYPDLISDMTVHKIAVKPRLKGGSIDLKVYEREHFPEGIESDDIAEEFLDLPLIHVDGILRNGELAFFTISKYENTCLSFYDKQYLASKNHGHHHDNGKIKTILTELFNLIPTKESFAFHLELFHDHGSYYFCEIACRPGGSYLIQAIEEGYGVNINRAGMLLQVGLDVDIPATHRKKLTSFYLFPHGYTEHVDTKVIEGLQSLIRYDIAEKKEISEHSADPHIGVFLANADRQQLLDDESRLLMSLSKTL